MTLTKPVKIGIAVVLVLIAVVAIYFIAKGGSTSISTPAGGALPGTGSGATTGPWKIIFGSTQEQTDAFCNAKPDSGLCEKLT